MKVQKALIVEEEVATRQMIASVLSELQYMAIFSSSGRHAWQTLWDNSDITLVVASMLMSDMDGKELAHIIRANPAFKELPLIILTSSVTSQDVDALLRMGSCLLCGKPVHHAELRDCIRALTSH